MSRLPLACAFGNFIVFILFAPHTVNKVDLGNENEGYEISRNFVSGAYSTAPCALLDHSCKMILRYKVSARFQALAVIAYGLFIWLLCSDVR